MALKPGDTLLNGHYRILRLLGRGGFGFVYQARDTLLDRDVAIKELIPGLVGDEAMLKRFLGEARATMELTHERIVRTHNVFQEGDNYYIAMECMAGGSLEERLREHGPLPVAEAVQVAAQVCEGLAYAHRRGVVHCDLKPANILFDAQGQAKVADFGIAHVSGEMLTRSWYTPAGFVAGTLAYMSPEQTEGERKDPRIDVYALGAVLYRMLAGQTYLEFDPRETPRSQSDNVQRIFEEQPLPPSTHSQGIPAWLDGVVLQALAKRPEARYADAGAMGAALRQGPPEPIAPTSPTRLTPSPPAPSPTPIPAQPKLSGWFWAVAGAVGVLLMVLVIVLVVVPLIGDDQETPVAALTTVPALAPSHTPTLTTMPTETHTPRPKGTATDTPRPTATSTPRPTDTPKVPTATDTPQPTATLVPTPTDTPLPPTATDTLQPTATLAPAATPTPAAPRAGATSTRSKDGMVMVYVPAGEFLMGSTDADGQAEDDEKPQHTVYLDAFWIDRTEVTNAHYRKCVEAGTCEAPVPCPAGRGEATFDDQTTKANHPVVCVSWYDAAKYCQWAGVRLPTEAEWEKAARGTDGRVYPWGNSFDGSRLNFCDSSCERERGWPAGDISDGYSRTAPVGSYPAGASPYGLLDMAGNVSEWVNDWYDSGYYGRSPARNPLGPDTGTGRRRVTRGGSWNDGARRREQLSAADRGWLSWGDDTGFRCARSGSEP